MTQLPYIWKKKLRSRDLKNLLFPIFSSDKLMYETLVPHTTFSNYQVYVLCRHAYTFLSIFNFWKCYEYFAKIDNLWRLVQGYNKVASQMMHNLDNSRLTLISFSHWCKCLKSWYFKHLHFFRAINAQTLHSLKYLQEGPCCVNHYTL